jgi:hypothetical protein
MKFSQLWARVEHTENTTVHGKTPMSHTDVLWEESIPSENVVRYEWKEWTFHVDKQFQPFFRYEYIQSFLVLKLTLGRSFRFDKSAEIALISGHCLKATEAAVDGEIPGPPPEPARPRRLRCERCSYSFKLKDEDVDFATCPSCGAQIYF